ncbi:helix-turn-helix domain-containing protein [Actinomadura algeriensis]|uniref:Transcriptional regulator with XRE-family HTH domain n=1 Tax=Actinomadura algeriensis TaxID=1679523 RepID=A0ABR9JIR5_9ACTN|nr:helix-turn-helix transcriptional regulator [Actinomadura algeriensis]MBE1530454.1 transcriptional regulator with XRE-family HTH domain [Actinomadura algeriensis]
MSTSIVLRRRLAAELRTLRHKAGLSQEELAEHLGAAVSKIVRIENAQSTVSLSDLRVMLALYSVPSKDQESLLELARNARKRQGWWSAYRDLLPSKYVALEAEASDIYNYEPTHIPGLLQTEEYSRALQSADRRLHQEDIDRYVAARMTRQESLWRDEPSLSLHAIIDEAALHRIIGGPEVMAAQLRRIEEATQRPNITVKIMPFGTGAYPSLGVPFVILGFRDPRDPDVVLVEGRGENYFESAEEVAMFRADWIEIDRMATSATDVPRLIRDIIKEIVPWQKQKDPA